MKHDVIIVGGGIIGCTTAHFLTRAGLRVVLLEKGALARGTTGNSFAWAYASTKTGDEIYHRLNAAGVAGYEALAAEFGAESLGVFQTGAMQVVGRSDAIGFRAMQDRFVTLQRFEYPCEWMDSAKLKLETPGLMLPDDAEALLLPIDMVIDAPRVARSLAETARKGGANIHENCPAIALIVGDKGAVHGIETADDRFEAPKVILAVGADTGQLLADLTGFDAFASRFPMREVPGLLLTTPPLDHNPLKRLLFGSTTNELHLLPAPNGGIRIGSDEIDSVVWEDRSEAAMRRGGVALLARAAQIIPNLLDCVSLDECTLQIGVRPYPEDGQPIIGPLPGSDGLIIVATHSGITLSPIIAAQMADLMRRNVVPDFAAFSLTRFPGF